MSGPTDKAASPVLAAWLVVSETTSNGRRRYLSKVRGVLFSTTVDKARRFENRDEADRWAAMLQRDVDRGVGGQRLFVVKPCATQDYTDSPVSL